MRTNYLVKELFEKYFKVHVEQHTSRPHDTKRGFELHWKTLANKRADLLTVLEVQEWLVDVAAKSGAQSANRQFNTLRACLNWSEKMGLATFKRNPCKGVTRMETAEREEYLKPGDQYLRLKEALEKQPQEISDPIWLFLFTAARKSNVLNMKWEDIDLESQVWTVQKTDSKNKKSMRIALTVASMAILQRRASELQHKTRWVFPSPDSLLHHRVNIDYKWRQIRDEAGLSELHIHDLRHTAATWMGLCGSSAFAIQQAMHHSSSKISERYTHLSQDMVRGELEKSQAAFM